jgi:hypothetical protein
MILDEMSAPLGQKRADKCAEFPVPLPMLIRIAFATVVLGFTAWVMIGNEPPVGEAIAMNALPPGVAAAKQTATEETQSRNGAVPVETPPQPAGKTVTIIDGSSGKRQEIVLPAPPEYDTEAEDDYGRNTIGEERKAEKRVSFQVSASDRRPTSSWRSSRRRSD